jgi:hypothetical protein
VTAGDCRDHDGRAGLLSNYICHPCMPFDLLVEGPRDKPGAPADALFGKHG